MAEPFSETALPTLRLLTCGSVDDGKSTLIGRLLYEQKLIFDDQLSALERDSKKHGTVGADIDFALLVDGLEAEREQGITIDVAYRYFATPRRSFIVADTPGHEQYTRNMATGASNADLAILLVDARKGLLTQTHRHAIIASLLGIRHVVLAVNKIDLVDYDEATFRRIVDAFAAFAEPLDFRSLVAIPISARFGDNISALSPRTPWHDGPYLIDHLERVEVEDERRNAPFRLPVQWVNRPHLDFRGFAGTIAGGRIKRGDAIVVASSGRHSAVTGILRAGEAAEEAEAGDAVTLTLADEVDVARGDVLAPPAARPEVADQFTAHLIWMSHEPLLPGRSYLMKIGARTVPASVTELKHRIDVDNFDKLAAKTLALNEVGFANLAAHRAGRLRPLRGEPRDRGLHPDRPRHQRNGGGGDDRPRPAPRHQHPPPGPRRLARGARGDQAPAAGDPVVHRPLRRRQIDDRQSGREQADRRAASTPLCSTATTSATASTRTSASPPRTGSRTSAASPRSRG